MPKMVDKNLALAGGGTGGHFYPMLAFAQYVREKAAFTGLYYVGDRNGIEGQKEHLLKDWFDEYKLLSMAKFKGRTPIGVALSALQTVIGALRLAPFLGLRGFISLTFGGYTSATLGLYTLATFKPLYIHEQNTIPGMGNTALGKFARRVFVAFPRAARFFPDYKTVVTGMPIRKELKSYKSLPREFVLKSLGWEDKFSLLVLGGSQGAKKLNQVAVWLSQHLPSDMRLIHITGESHFKDIEYLYRINPPKCEVKVFPFVENIGRIYRITDFAISRAGASTAMELSFFGIPTIFIPYPHAAYDHQFYNAYYFYERGGAYIFREDELNLKEVLEIVLNHFRDSQLHENKRFMMETSFIPNAEEKMLKEILDSL